MGAIETAAESVLFADRNKSLEFGGGRLEAVQTVTANEDTGQLTLRMRDGSEKHGFVTSNAGLINHPEKRERMPADVHDAVKATIFEALEIDLH